MKEQEKLIEKIKRLETNGIVEMIKTGQIPEALLEDSKFMEELKKSNPHVEIALKQLEMEQDEKILEEEISEVGLKDVIQDEEKLERIPRKYKEELYGIAKEYEESGEYQKAKAIYQKVSDFGKSQINRFLEKFNKHEENRETTYYKARYSYYMCKIKNGEELTEQEKEDLEKIVYNDKDKNALELLTPGKLSDMDVFRSYFRDITIEEFETGVLPEVAKKQRNHPDNPNPPTDSKDYPEELSPEKRCKFIKENFKIKNIKIPVEEKLAGYVLFEIEDSDVIIAEKLFMLNKQGKEVPSNNAATYLVHKDAKIELDKISQTILYDSKAKEQEKGTNLIQSVNHRGYGYYDRLLKKFKNVEERGKYNQIENDNIVPAEIQTTEKADENAHNEEKTKKTEQAETELDSKEDIESLEDISKLDEKQSEDGKTEDDAQEIKKQEPEVTEKQYSLDELADMIDLFDEEHAEFERQQQEVQHKIKEMLEQNQTSIDSIGTEKMTAKEALQILREQKKVLSKLEEELEKISSQDKGNRQLRDKLIGELKSRMQKGEL